MFFLGYLFYIAWLSTAACTVGFRSELEQPRRYCAAGMQFTFVHSCTQLVLTKRYTLDLLTLIHQA